MVVTERLYRDGSEVTMFDVAVESSCKHVVVEGANALSLNFTMNGRGNILGIVDLSRAILRMIP